MAFSLSLSNYPSFSSLLFPPKYIYGFLQNTDMAFSKIQIWLSFISVSSILQPPIPSKIQKWLSLYLFLIILHSASSYSIQNTDMACSLSLSNYSPFCILLFPPKYRYGCSLSLSNYPSFFILLFLPKYIYGLLSISF